MNTSLAEYAPEFKSAVRAAILEVKTALGVKRCAEVYGDAVKHFSDTGVPKLMYVVTHDEAYPVLPVRPVHWEENWKAVQAAGGG